MTAKISIFILILTLFFAPHAFAGKPASSTPTPKSVCIDPGHGGTDAGAVNQDLLEKNVNLDVALLLESKLQAAGFTTFMTRRDDRTLSNADRYNYCNGQRAAILVSVHHNGSTNPNVDYTMALYAKRADMNLATIVASTVSSQLALPNNGISRFASGVLLKAEMPATISEGFFLTNTNEYNLIKNSGRLDQEANALLSAIQTYFGN